MTDSKAAKLLTNFLHSDDCLKNNKKSVQVNNIILSNYLISLKFKPKLALEPDKSYHHNDSKTMIACKFFDYVCVALLVSVFEIVCCLEFSLPVCSESHAKAEYTLQDPIECKPHVPHLIKQCNISIFKQEHFVYNIPAISSQQLLPLPQLHFTFLEQKLIPFPLIIQQYHPFLNVCYGILC